MLNNHISRAVSRAIVRKFEIILPQRAICRKENAQNLNFGLQRGKPENISESSENI